MNQKWPNMTSSPFLFAPRWIYKRLCQSVGQMVSRSVGWSVGRLVGWSVGRSVDQSQILNPNHTVALIGLALFGKAAESAATHWAVSIATIVIIVVCSQHLQKIEVPLGFDGCFSRKANRGASKTGRRGEFEYFRCAHTIC